MTVKGKGCQPAEADDADCLHTVGVIDPATGRPDGACVPTWTSVFADEMFLPHASRDEFLRAHGLDGAGIATAVLKRLATTHRAKIARKGVGQ